MNDEAVQDLARRAGIAVEWNDYAGRPQVVGLDVLQRILAALGLPCATRGDLAASRRELARNTNLRALPPFITATAGRPTRLDAGASEPHHAKLQLEAGGQRDISISPVRGRLRVPAIAETGYHRLVIDDRDIVLAVAPTRCRTIDDAVPDARLWGLAAQVYSLRRSGDGGIGDAGGIAALAEAAGRRGADALALSPLHALFTANPARFGPYSPSTRLFLNPLHAAPGLVFGAEYVARAMAEAGLAETFARLEALKLIDWPGAAAAKLALLRTLFDDFMTEPEANGALATDFARFRADGGDLLAQHAIFEALHAEQSAGGTTDWRRWPADLRDPTSATVAVFAASRRDEVLFHTFLQWLVDRSLAVAQQRAQVSGMRIGLISDLAVGMDPIGSHAWSRQGDIVGGLSIGAPPDLLNTRGQDWNLTGFSPRALIAGGFAPFLTTVRAALRHAGGLRIDHAMGLARLWLIPEGATPADGAYLAYPATDLLRLLAMESQRHQAIVIGEDLGTLPYGFHETLETAGVHGMRVLWFEREGQAFAAPDRWDHSAVAMTSTHDLPTVAGWWHGTDIATRAACDRLGNGVSEADAMAERTGDRAALWQAFVREGVADGNPPPPENTPQAVDAALAFVARTHSPLCLLPVEDVIGQKEQPNLPGTMDEHPNWRRRLPADAGAILDTPEVAARVTKLAAKRPRL
jgi:4-alpha-glucanotransferase